MNRSEPDAAAADSAAPVDRDDGPGSAGPPRLDDVIALPGQGNVAVLLGSLVLLVGLALGMARLQRWFRVTGPVQIRTTNASGLQQGMDVRISGYRVGQVEGLRLDSDAQVTVSLLVEPNYRPLLGPLSEARLMQDNLIGVPYLALSPDPRALVSTSTPAALQRRLVLRYIPPVNITDLIAEVAESRLPLNRLLETTSRLAEQRLPQTVAAVEGTMRSAQSLAEELRIQARSTGAEARSTTAEARRTLAVYRNLGLDGQRRLDRAEADLRSHTPLVIETLKDLNGMSQTVNRLVQRVSSSWLMQLLEASRVPAPLGPASERRASPDGEAGRLNAPGAAPASPEPGGQVVPTRPALGDR